MDQHSPASGLVAAAEEVSGLAAKHAADADQARRLHPNVIRAVGDAGFVRHFVPARWGGGEGTFADIVTAVATVGEGCASAAWIASLTANGPRTAAYLPEEGQRELWGEGPDTFLVSALMPIGSADPVAGGWRLTGRWSFIFRNIGETPGRLLGIATPGVCGAITLPRRLTWPSMLSARVPTPPVSADNPAVRLVDAPHAYRRLQRGGDPGTSTRGRRLAPPGSPTATGLGRPGIAGCAGTVAAQAASAPPDRDAGHLIGLAPSAGHQTLDLFEHGRTSAHPG